MCLHCAMREATKLRHEALDWTRDQLKNIPDEFVIEFGNIFWRSLPLIVRGEKRCETREEAIELMAGLLFGLKKSGQKFDNLMEQAFNAGELRGHAA